MRAFFFFFCFCVSAAFAQSLDNAGSVPSEAQLTQLETAIAQVEARNGEWQK